MIEKLLNSSTSMRRIAVILGINRKTVARKVTFLAHQAGMDKKTYLLQFTKHPLKLVFMDEMQTHEITKCKPVSIPLVVTEGRKIIGIDVGQMSARGPLAEISRKKYGPRKDESAKVIERMLWGVKPYIAKDAKFIIDEKSIYPKLVKKVFPKARIKTYKGRRGCVTGQGELKKTGKDPLFELNHTCAMIRDNIKRLARKTWCTTQKRSELLKHLTIYANYHNQILT